MKKILSFALVMLVAVSMFAITAFAAPVNSTPKYYDASGRQIYGNDYYYDDNNVPMFGSNCYYMNGRNRNYVADQQVYVYNSDKKLVAATNFYDANGNPIDPANMNANGWYNCYWGYNNGSGYKNGSGYGRGCCGW